MILKSNWYDSYLFVLHENATGERKCGGRGSGNANECEDCRNSYDNQRDGGYDNEETTRLSERLCFEQFFLLKFSYGPLGTLLLSLRAI